MKYKYNGTGNNGTFAWIMQRISGVVIGIYGLVIFYQAMFAEAGMHNLSLPLLLPLLIFGMWHTFSGFKMITDDYVASPTKRFVLFLIYWGVGIALLVIGYDAIRQYI
ncbi:MAG: succinate dehydrogenase [Deferribacteraceae bacterium]|jgi:succinate dehydrogenase / fumarate reductase membrane anchor subunit|nr:succinate dehydrogenase [Deferribacteraceae bacterium]